MDIVGARDNSDDGRASVRRYGNYCASAPHGSSTRVLCDPVCVFIARNSSLLAANAAVTRTFCPSSSLLTPNAAVAQKYFTVGAKRFHCEDLLSI